MKNLIGADIGGSHITLAEVDSESRSIISSTYTREHVDSFANKEIILSAWETAFKKVTDHVDKANLQIGIAMPGPFDYENGIALMLHGKFIDLYHFNIKEDLAKRLGISANQIHFINDAAAFLEGEIFAGCVQQYNRIFGITLGTGLGTSFYNGTLASDEDLWNSPLKDTICEDYLATRWFVNRYRELTGEEISGVKELLEKPEEIKNKIFDEYADSLSEFITKYVKFYDPEVLVIAGNISKAYPFFKDKFLQNLERNNIDLKIEISKIFEDAAILGAASHALKNKI